jgi:hypothetical protein
LPLKAVVLLGWIMKMGVPNVILPSFYEKEEIIRKHFCWNNLKICQKIKG